MSLTIYQRGNNYVLQVKDEVFKCLKGFELNNIIEIIDVMGLKYTITPDFKEIPKCFYIEVNDKIIIKERGLNDSERSLDISHRLNKLLYLKNKYGRWNKELEKSNRLSDVKKTIEVPKKKQKNTNFGRKLKKFIKSQDHINQVDKIVIISNPNKTNYLETGFECVREFIREKEVKDGNTNRS